MGQVDGKIALVTGGASGIGEACAQTLAREGAAVIISDIDDVRGNDLASAINSAGEKAVYLRHDVTDESRWQEIVAEIESRHGRLDILVANAGIGIMVTSIAEMSLADWRRQTAVNLDGAFLSVKYCLPLMRRHSRESPGGGSIIMTSSIAGLRGSATLAGYCATKGGVRLFGKAIAMECAARGDNIRVNTVHPGIIDTPIWGKIRPDLAAPGSNAPIDIEEIGRAGAPLGRVGKPQDIANGVLFLASDASNYITGTELVIDGGITGGAITRRGPLAMTSAHE
ncbi:MAG: glucose 1-dehydrogenase [Alphaproteobacteria bacterium]|nr:glucose 1-dehydrogenase [Alphaproteobacteria bacterium]MBV9583820.1 glucose 1-dehydrogenase [Alphaproteobacteria bacterium]